MKRECKLISIISMLYPYHTFDKRAIRVYYMDYFTNMSPVINIFDDEEIIPELGKIVRVIYHDIDSLRYGVFI